MYSTCKPTSNRKPRMYNQNQQKPFDFRNDSAIINMRSNNRSQIHRSAKQDQEFQFPIDYHGSRQFHSVGNRDIMGTYDHIDDDFLTETAISYDSTPFLRTLAEITDSRGILKDMENGALGPWNPIGTRSKEKLHAPRRKVTKHIQNHFGEPLFVHGIESPGYSGPLYPTEPSNVEASNFLQSTCPIRTHPHLNYPQEAPPATSLSLSEPNMSTDHKADIQKLRELFNSRFMDIQLIIDQTQSSASLQEAKLNKLNIHITAELQRTTDLFLKMENTILLQWDEIALLFNMLKDSKKDDAITTPCTLSPHTRLPLSEPAGMKISSLSDRDKVISEISGQTSPTQKRTDSTRYSCRSIAPPMDAYPDTPPSPNHFC